MPAEGNQRATEDSNLVAEVMIAMGSVDAKVDVDARAKDLATAYAPLVASGAAGIKYADLIPLITRTAVKHGMRLPPSS